MEATFGQPPIDISIVLSVCQLPTNWHAHQPSVEQRAHQILVELLMSVSSQPLVSLKTR